MKVQYYGKTVVVTGAGELFASLGGSVINEEPELAAR